jgi:hypothetical protein
MSRNPVVEKAAVSPPSLPAFVPSIIATAILSVALGYWIGVGNSFLSYGSSKRRHKKRKEMSDDGASSSSDISSEDDAGSENMHLGNSHEECKMVPHPRSWLMNLGVSSPYRSRNDERKSCIYHFLYTLNI